jgi:hypothetical protein
MKYLNYIILTLALMISTVGFSQDKNTIKEIPATVVDIPAVDHAYSCPINYALADKKPPVITNASGGMFVSNVVGNSSYNDYTIRSVQVVTSDILRTAAPVCIPIFNESTAITSMSTLNVSMGGLYIPSGDDYWEIGNPTSDYILSLYSKTDRIIGIKKDGTVIRFSNINIDKDTKQFWEQLAEMLNRNTSGN